MKRKICIFTGTRADYGLLKPLIDEINRDSQLILQIIASGTHLSADFGLTYKEIEIDGFCIDKKVDINLRSDSSVGVAASMGLAIEKLARAYHSLKPDIIVGLGDRYELFSAAAAALVSMIPFAHLSGGEITQGVIDDSLRHAITKMSHLHFTSTKEARERVVQLGESPDHVFAVGEIGLDNIKENLLTREQLEKQLKFNLKKHNLMVTFHPITLEKGTSEKYFLNLLEALDQLKDTSLVFTKANADMGGRGINRLIDEYICSAKGKAIAFASMGRRRYLSALKYSDALVGNSSSGLVEAPSFKVGTINIGDRQKGRPKAKSVIDCEPTVQDIRQALKKLYSPGFQKQLKRAKNPFGDEKSSPRVKKILKNFILKDILKKKFYDLRVKK